MIRVTWWELKEGVRGLSSLKIHLRHTASEERLVVLLIAGRKMTSFFA